MGSNSEEALRVIIPFARKKSTEFWVWQLLSDVFVNDAEKQLACLLRAVNCRTQENFLGKVRIKLATLFTQQQRLDCAKYQIDKVTQCYLSHGWRVPYEIDCWIHQPWIKTVTANGKAPIDYMAITDGILCEGTEEAYAVVTGIDQKSRKATLIYGYEKRISQKLRLNVGIGAILKINYITESDGKIRILISSQSRLPDNLNYAKVVEGGIRKAKDKDFAFLKAENKDVFISPNIVRKYNIQHGENIKCLIAYDYNRKKNHGVGYVSIFLTMLTNRKMEELTYSAKIAIIIVLEEILKADSIVRDSEIEYMNEVVKSFCLGNDYKEDVNKLMTLQALSIIKELTIDQKGEVAKMMGKMIVIDKDINYNEVMMYNTFCESCNIEKDFNVNEYPESSLSGPFINPEDMMNML